MGHPKETETRLPEVFAEVWYRMENTPHFKRTWVGRLQSVFTLWAAIRKQPSQRRISDVYPRRYLSFGERAIPSELSRRHEHEPGSSLTPTFVKLVWGSPAA